MLARCERRRAKYYHTRPSGGRASRPKSRRTRSLSPAADHGRRNGIASAFTTLGNFADLVEAFGDSLHLLMARIDGEDVGSAARDSGYGDRAWSSSRLERHSR